MNAAYEWWTTWVWGGPWHTTDGKYLLSEHKSGIMCHLRAFIVSLALGQRRGAHAAFATSEWKNKTWYYG